MKIDIQRFMGKRFVVSMTTVVVLSLISIALIVLFLMNKVVFMEISNILTTCLVIIGAVAGGFLGVQTMVDRKNVIKDESKGDGK